MKVVGTAKRRLGLSNSLPDATQSTLVMPIRLGGFGLRPVSLVSPAAFYSAAAQAAQDIARLFPEAKRPSLLCDGPSQLRFASHVGDALKRLLDAGLKVDLMLFCLLKSMVSGLDFIWMALSVSYNVPSVVLWRRRTDLLS